MTTSAYFDPFAAHYLADPYPALSGLRADEPVFFAPEVMLVNPPVPLCIGGVPDAYGSGAVLVEVGRLLDVDPAPAVVVVPASVEVVDGAAAIDRVRIRSVTAVHGVRRMGLYLRRTSREEQCQRKQEGNWLEKRGQHPAPPLFYIYALPPWPIQSADSESARAT